VSLFHLPPRQARAVQAGLKEARDLRIAEAINAERTRQREVATQQAADRATRIAAAGGIRALGAADYKRERAEMLRGLRHW